MWLRIVLALLLVGSVTGHAAKGADASCKPIERPNFVRIPARVAVLIENNDAALFEGIADLNRRQNHYQLTFLPGTDPLSFIEKSISGYDAILVFDRQMMVNDSPKYNRHLFTYRNKNLSDMTMIIDFRFDNKRRIASSFLQIAAGGTKARLLLMEIGLMALADLGRMTDVEFVNYYEQVDRIVEYKDDQLHPDLLDGIMKAREEIVLGCFLRAD